MAAFWIFGKTHRLKTMMKNAASENAGFTPNFAKNHPQKPLNPASSRLNCLSYLFDPIAIMWLVYLNCLILNYKIEVEYFYKPHVSINYLIKRILKTVYQRLGNRGLWRPEPVPANRNRKAVPVCHLRYAVFYFYSGITRAAATHFASVTR